MDVHFSSLTEFYFQKEKGMGLCYDDLQRSANYKADELIKRWYNNPTVWEFSPLETLSRKLKIGKLFCQCR